MGTVSANVDIANMALQRLGQPVISTLTESSRDANICNQLFDQNRDYCLMITDWSCLTQRAVLDRSGKIAITGATQVDPCVVSCTGHLFVTNELVTIEDVTGMTQLNGNSYKVYSYTSGTITLYDLDGTSTDGSAFSAWVSGGYVYRDPGGDWAYVYDLPSDCLKVLDVLDSSFGSRGYEIRRGGPVDSNYEWKVERTHLYADMECAGVRYVKKNTDPTTYDPGLVEIMVSRLAWFISMRINSDKQLRSVIYQEMSDALRKSRVLNAQGREDEGSSNSLWTDAR